MAEALKLFAGVDAGASHTTLLLGDDLGSPLKRVRGGPGILRPGRTLALAGRIAALLEKGLRTLRRPISLEAVVVGAAGAGREADRSELERALRKKIDARSVLVTSDAAVALEGAFRYGPGIVVLAGTGSIAMGRNASGTVHRVGGWGWKFGDEGSSYSLARAALSAVARAADGRGPETLLTSRMLEAARKGSVEDLLAWARAARPERVAALAPVVCQVAKHDPVAALLVQAATEELARHVLVLRERLSDPTLPVALGGGLLAEGSPVREALAERLEAETPPVNLVDWEVDPAFGALLLAVRLRP